MDVAPRDPVAAALDGATRDSAVSGDAMRWSPDLAEEPGEPPVPALPGPPVRRALPAGREE